MERGESKGKRKGKSKRERETGIENSGDKKGKRERGKSMLPVGFEPTTFRSSV